MKSGSHPHSLGLGLTSPASRARLIAELKREGISDARVLDVLQKLPRHEFVEEAWRGEAYKNKPLPIGSSQTISQPYIVALMTQLLLEPAPGGAARKKVLEIGTGSGYQTAVLAELVQNVFSVERIEGPCRKQARLRACASWATAISISATPTAPPAGPRMALMTASSSPPPRPRCRNPCWSSWSAAGGW